MAEGEGVTVRPSRDDDVPSIAGIYGHHVMHGLGSFEESAPTAEEMARRRAEIVGRGFPYLVAELGGRVVGYAYCSQYRPRPGYRFSVEDSIYIEPGREGGGVGSLLLPRLIAAATARGARQMIAVIGDSANAGSIRLHARFGFRQVGIIEAIGFKRGRWVDSVLMQRALGDGASSLPPQA
jgi:L-amino acid N-acyltransferase YncA